MAVRRSVIYWHESLGEMPIFPGDHLVLFGEREQIEAAVRYLGEQKDEHHVSVDYSLEKIFVPRTAKVVGLSLQEANLPRVYGTTVVGIQRREEKIVGPRAGEVVRGGDVLLVVGWGESIQRLKGDLG